MLRVAGLEKQRFTLRSSASQEDGEAMRDIDSFRTATEEPLSGQYTKDLIFIDFAQMIQLKLMSNRLLRIIKLDSDRLRFTISKPDELRSLTAK